MKNQALEFDTFDTALSELLQGQEMPAADFTARVMAQVAQTPQEQQKTAKRPTSRRALWTVAACAAVVVLCVPFLNGHKPADKAAPAAAPAEAAMDDAMVAMDTSAADGAGEYKHSLEDGVTAATADGHNTFARESDQPDWELYQAQVEAEEPAAPTLTEAMDKQPHDLGGSNESVEMLTVVVLEPEVFREVSDWLRDQGYPYEDGYTLTAADVAALNEQFPGLELEEVDCILQEG